MHITSASEFSRYKKQKLIKCAFDSAEAQFDITNTVLRVTKDVVDVLYSYKQQGMPFSDAFNDICQRNLIYFEKTLSNYSIWLKDINDLSLPNDIKDIVKFIHDQYLVLPRTVNNSEIYVNILKDVLDKIDSLCKSYTITTLPRHTVISFIFSKDNFDDLNIGVRKIHKRKFYFIEEGLKKYEKLFDEGNDEFLDINTVIVNNFFEGFTKSSSTKILEYILNLLVVIEKRNRNESFNNLIITIKNFIEYYNDMFLLEIGNEPYIKQIKMKINELNELK